MEVGDDDAFTLKRLAASAGTTAAFTIEGQAAGASGAGGDLVLAGGAQHTSGGDGSVLLKTGTTTGVTVAPSDVTVSPAGTQEVKVSANTMEVGDDDAFTLKRLAASAGTTSAFTIQGQAAGASGAVGDLVLAGG